MDFQWKEYLSLAKFLQGYSSTFTQEAAHRTATSRAYYAAYCHARNYAADRFGFRPSRTSDDHQLVRETFHKERKFLIAQDLDRLRQWRNHCDYDNRVSNLSSISRQAISLAEKVFTLLK